MLSKWRKTKVALGLNLCVYVPRTLEDAASSEDLVPRTSDTAPISSESGNSDARPAMPTTSAPPSPGLRLSKIASMASKKTCAICLDTVKPGQGHAIFTAECSHSFHFHCIASNVKHGNQICPVCRAKWKEIPFQGPSPDLVQGRSRINPVDWGGQEDNLTTVVRRLPPPGVNSNRQRAASFHTPEPTNFNDDEPLGPTPEMPHNIFAHPASENSNYPNMVGIKVNPELSSLSSLTSHENFAVLVHLKAPSTILSQNFGRDPSNSPVSTQSCRAPVDLVTVLDVSGSMAGTKLALLKRAMGFVIQNLGPSDRLSVVAFSSTSRRLFPLLRMSDSGRQQALQAVNSLVSGGSTNIIEGLKKGTKVMDDRRDKNPVSGIILLSDGQDTYSTASLRTESSQPDYQSLLPSSISRGAASQIPVHTFGFGVDHDSASMHSISEASGGTFSFIEAEEVIQDAFAQCIGGLLSVIAQQLHVDVECISPGVEIASVNAGSYQSLLYNESCTCSIEVGNLYAEEERDFLLYLNVPVGDAGQGLPLLKVGCAYRDPISKERIHLDGQEVRVGRSESATSSVVSIEVDREKHRIRAAEAMAQARASAERGYLGAAVEVLESCRKALLESASSRAGDQLCTGLDAELKEMQERLASRRAYESSGRAYMLSGLSAHLWQRATARGHSTELSSHVHTYQTQSMVDMLERSQNIDPRARQAARPAPFLTPDLQPR